MSDVYPDPDYIEPEILPRAEVDPGLVRGGRPSLADRPVTAEEPESTRRQRQLRERYLEQHPEERLIARPVNPS